MQTEYTNPIYEYDRSPDADNKATTHHPVIIVGAGPGGLALAVDLAIQGIKSVVVDDNNTVSVGSRAICFAKRTLEIMDRLGSADRMVAKGVTWKQGKVFFKDELVYDFSLLEESDHKLPAFINLQQYYFEEYLVDRAAEFEEIDIRWKTKVTKVHSQTDKTEIWVEVPDGKYKLSCDYLLCADGSRSPVRSMLGLDSKGQVFLDHFLIADVVMKAAFPTERWFWFDPPFHPNQSALLHKQPDNIWRIDLQLGWDADPEHEKQEHVVRPRIQAMLGKDAEFEVEWASVYTFQCRKMDNFIHNRVVFVGDAAHQVSPFGARGANGCIQSAENLVWKIARVLKGKAPAELVNTYNTERQHGAKENILNSTRATDFITPKNHISRVFRDQTLKLAKNYTFARTLVNSGRLSMPCQYLDSPLNSKDTDTFNSPICPGSVPKDAPVLVANETHWLMNQLGNQFVLLVKLDNLTPQINDTLHTLFAQQDLKIVIVGKLSLPPALATQVTQVESLDNILLARYDLAHLTTYLFRPDQIVCARWRAFNTSSINTAIQTSLGFNLVPAMVGTTKESIEA
jgi:3-(3-hydroxy-phenyl)propionate hydroxylase